MVGDHRDVDNSLGSGSTMLLSLIGEPLLSTNWRSHVITLEEEELSAFDEKTNAKMLMQPEHTQI